jgi:MoaA/NifB/PqqE/SkfB family radical SAM enzyme
MESISISLDGLKETHESFRKVPNCYQKILENIKKLQKVPCIKVVQVTTVANKKNLKELEDLYRLMQDMNIISWRVINVDPIGRAKENSEILLDKEDYIYLFEKGRVIEEGTHTELLAKGGKYAQMFNSQSKKYLGGDYDEE